MSQIEDDLFGLDLLAEPDLDEAPKRSKQPYKTATIRPPTRLEAMASEDSLMSESELWERVPLSELYVSQSDILAGKGRNGLNMIGLFDGAGGSMTGFTWSGWNDIASVEFVEAARETLHANYPDSVMINPDEVMESGIAVAKEMGLEVVLPKKDTGDKVVLLYPDRKVRHKGIASSINWEETLLRLGGNLANDFRTRTNKHLFAKHKGRGKTILWGDDIRGLDATVLMEAAGLKRGELDCLEGSPPCFPAGTMVICQDRIRPIEEVQVGHVVLTHKGRWRRVIDTMNRISDTVVIDGGRIEATPDHPFYARQWSNPKSQINSLLDPEWIHAENMEGAFYSTPYEVEAQNLPDDMPQLYSDIDPTLFWRIVGRWLGDGWLRHNTNHDGDNVWTPRAKRGGMSTEPRLCANECGKMAATHERYTHLYTLFCSRDCQVERNRIERSQDNSYHGGSRGEVFLCSSLAEHDDLWEQLSETEWGWSAWLESDTVWRYRMANIELARWLFKHFSKGAASKTIPGWVLGMDREYREALLRGYLDADGSKTLPDHKERATSVSRALAVGIRTLGSTLDYSTGWQSDIFGIGTDQTDGFYGVGDYERAVQVRKQYSVSLVAEEYPRYNRTEFGLRWQKMRGATTTGRTDVRVFDITVEEDHSFVADGYVVHNCKSFSTSGLREQGWGRVLHYSDERDQRTDDLFWEFLRILDAVHPRSFVAENVAGLGMGAAEMDVMAPLMEAFDDLGYSVEAKVLNAKDYNVPQSRPRMIFMGIRKDQHNIATGARSYPIWPEPSPVSYATQDALDAASVHNSPEDIVPAWLGTKGDLRSSLISIGMTGPDADDLIAEWWPQTIKSGSLDRSLKGEEANVSVPWPDAQPRYETGRIWYTLAEGGSPENKAYQLIRCHSRLPSPTITATSAGNQPAAGPTHPHECRKFTIPEYRALFSFPWDYQFTGTVDQQGERMGRSVPPYLMKQIADSVANILLASETVV